MSDRDEGEWAVYVILGACLVGFLVWLGYSVLALIGVAT